MTVPMDVDGAIRAHVDWRIRFAAYLRHPDGSLAPVAVAWEDDCRLCEWLSDENNPHMGSAEFMTLHDRHAAFHRAAVDQALGGQRPLVPKGQSRKTQDPAHTACGRG